MPPERLADELGLMRADERVLGLNLSLPHKEAVLDLLDGLDDAARAIGAVNTVVRAGGGLRGLNTDAPGFLAALADGGCDPSGRDVLVLGAGGAARAVVFALLGRGARVSVANRTLARAERLTETLGGQALSLPEAQRLAPRVFLIVNTTSAGLQGGATPWPQGPFPASGWALDITYRPLDTRFLRDAREAGCRTLDGLGMLVHQGALAFEAWTERPAPVAVMRAAAERALEGIP